ncbi:hypothetical protein FRC06_002985, partial [Ceratobasidium sp. 370]
QTAGVRKNSTSSPSDPFGKAAHSGAGRVDRKTVEDEREIAQRTENSTNSPSGPFGKAAHSGVGRVEVE